MQHLLVQSSNTIRTSSIKLPNQSYKLSTQINVDKCICYRYADGVLTGNEILVNENGKLNVVKVKKISSVVVQGIHTFNSNHLLLYKVQRQLIIYSKNYCLPGDFVLLTGEGNIMVNGVLASCYASFDHDLANFAMVPMQYCPHLVNWIFGEKNGIQGFVNIVKLLGRFLMPNKYLFVKNDFVYSD